MCLKISNFIKTWKNPKKCQFFRTWRPRCQKWVAFLLGDPLGDIPSIRALIFTITLTLFITDKTTKNLKTCLEAVLNHLVSRNWFLFQIIINRRSHANLTNDSRHARSFESFCLGPLLTRILIFSIADVSSEKRKEAKNISIDKYDDGDGLMLLDVFKLWSLIKRWRLFISQLLLTGGPIDECFGIVSAYITDLSYRMSFISKLRNFHLKKLLNCNNFQKWLPCGPSSCERLVYLRLLWISSFMQIHLPCIW